MTSRLSYRPSTALARTVADGAVLADATPPLVGVRAADAAGAGDVVAGTLDTTGVPDTVFFTEPFAEGSFASRGRYDNTAQPRVYAPDWWRLCRRRRWASNRRD